MTKEIFEDEILMIRRPELEDEKQVMEFRKMFLNRNETICGGSSLEKYDDYKEWLDNCRTYEINPPEGRVNGTQFLTIRKSDNKVVGMANVRHYLVEVLLRHGGHLGYCILPSERGKGYSTRQCALALKYLKKLGVNRVLITCNKNNTASAKTIIRNGGVLENEIIDDGITVQRYWIDN